MNVEPISGGAADARTEALIAAQYRRIGKARIDAGAFFEFAVREETSRAPLRLLPHQRVLFDFVAHHDRCVIRMPVGFTKTYSMAALSAWLLGQDPTARGAIVSSTQGQAEKPFSMVKEYVANSVALHAVFPKLRPTQRREEPWTQTRMTVDRPGGIRDPSLTAVGVDGALPGARLSWILVDDILDMQNTATPEGREKVRRWFKTTVLSRRDVAGSRVVVCNTPWNPEDLTYALEASGWPTLTMNIEGGIYFANSDFDSDDIRPSTHSNTEHRLTAHDAPDVLADVYAETGREPVDPSLDVEEVVPLWPAKFPRAEIARLREEFGTIDFNQLFMCTCRDDSSAKVKIEWIDKCKEGARTRGHFGMVERHPGNLPTFTGVDLGVGRKVRNDRTSIFTIAITPERKRLILEVDVGRWKGSLIVDKIMSVHERYNSIVRVENNAAQQFLIDWARERNIGVPIRAHTTGKNKADPRHGVESIFVEIEQGAWLIPNAPGGTCPAPVQQWIDDMYYYNPAQHTGDVLMSSWLAREQARASGALAGNVETGFSGSILAR